jgi:hypothetical protein
MLLGIHDVDAFVEALVTGADFRTEYRTTLNLIEAIEGGREAALDVLCGLLGCEVAESLGCCVCWAGCKTRKPATPAQQPCHSETRQPVCNHGTHFS